MLEKDKNCIEFSMRSMMATHKPYQEDTEIAITGLAPGKSLLLANNPFDIPCDVVVVSKRYFERLQADNQHCREMAKQWEENHNLLLKKTGFDTVESLVFYLTNVGCDTLLKTLASYISDRDKALEERENMKKKLEEREKDYISAVTKAETLDKENEQLKKKLHEFDPIPDYKELLEKLYSTEDVEKLEWTLNHICGGQASVNGWIATAKFWKQNCEALSKLVGFSSVEEIQDYLANEVECDTLREAMLKLIDENKYVCEEWCKAGELIEKWRKSTSCSTPEEAKSRIEGLENAVRLTDTTLLGELEREIDAWQKATGRIDPEAAKQYINRLEGRLRKIHDYSVEW